MVFDFETFQSRHIGPDAEETAAMLKAVGAASLDQLIDEAIPARIRLKEPLKLPRGESEYYFREFSLKRAYPMGINIVVYALTQ